MVCSGIGFSKAPQAPRLGQRHSHTDLPLVGAVTRPPTTRPWWESEARRRAGVRGELSSEQAPGLGLPEALLSGSSPNRRADQAGEAEAHHVLLQPAAVPGPGQLHRGAARRAPGPELRPRRGRRRAGPGVALSWKKATSTLEQGRLLGCAGLCPAAQGPTGPFAASPPHCGPRCHPGPLLRPGAPLPRDSPVGPSRRPALPALKPRGGSHGRRPRTRAWACRSSVCLCPPWTSATTSPQCLAGIPRMCRRASLAGGPGLQS